MSTRFRQSIKGSTVTSTEQDIVNDNRLVEAGGVLAGGDSTQVKYGDIDGMNIANVAGNVSLVDPGAVSLARELAANADERTAQTLLFSAGAIQEQNKANATALKFAGDATSAAFGAVEKARQDGYEFSAGAFDAAITNTSNVFDKSLNFIAQGAQNLLSTSNDLSTQVVNSSIKTIEATRDALRSESSETTNLLIKSAIGVIAVIAIAAVYTSKRKA